METPNLFELSIDGASSGFLKETSRWAKFLSIVGFVMTAVMILFSLGLLAIGSSNPLLVESFQNAGYGSSPAMLGIIYLVMGVVSIFPYLYLFQFGSKMKAALQSSDQEVLNNAFSSLKSCFKFVGVFTIILLGFLVLLFVLGVIGIMMGQQA